MSQQRVLGTPPKNRSLCVSENHREECLLEVPIYIDRDLTDRLTGIYSSVGPQHPLYPQRYFLTNARNGPGKRILSQERCGMLSAGSPRVCRGAKPLCRGFGGVPQIIKIPLNPPLSKGGLEAKEVQGEAPAGGLGVSPSSPFLSPKNGGSRGLKDDPETVSKWIRHTGGGEQEAKPLYSPLTWLDD